MKQLKSKLMTWFNNSIPQERGYLYDNKTLLHYSATCSMRCYFELITMNSNHEVSNLKEKLHFIDLQEKRGGIGFFVFELEHFQTIMANVVPNGVNLLAHKMAKDSVNYVRDRVNYAIESRCKTVMLNYDFKTLVI